MLPAARHDRWLFAWIVLFASVIRAGVLFWSFDSLTADPDAYRQIAHCITVHGVMGLESIDSISGEAKGIATAFRPPLYPWLISWLADKHGAIPSARIAILHWLLGIATVACVYVLALKMSYQDANGERRSIRLTAAMASLMVAIDPILLRSSTVVMTETLATFFSVLVLLGWALLVQSVQSKTIDKKFILAVAATGTFAGLAYLCRPTFVLWPLMLGTYLVAWGLTQQRRNVSSAGAAILAMITLFVSGWTIRNQGIFEKPIWATTHGGYTLLLGNNPPFFDYVETRRPFSPAWDPAFFFQRWEQRFSANPRTAEFWEPDSEFEPGGQKTAIVGEVADDRLAYETAIEAIKREPQGFARACAWRLMRLHGVLPLRTNGPPSRSMILVGVYYLATWLLVLVGLLGLRRRLFCAHWAAAFALWVSLATVHTLYWTDMRMRAPLIPVLAILAGGSAVAIRRMTGNSRLSDRQS